MLMRAHGGVSSLLTCHLARMQVVQWPRIARDTACQLVVVWTKGKPSTNVSSGKGRMSGPHVGYAKKLTSCMALVPHTHSQIYNTCLEGTLPESWSAIGLSML